MTIVNINNNSIFFYMNENNILLEVVHLFKRIMLALQWYVCAVCVNSLSERREGEKA